MSGPDESGGRQSVCLPPDLRIAFPHSGRLSKLPSIRDHCPFGSRRLTCFPAPFLRRPHVRSRYFRERRFTALLVILLVLLAGHPFLVGFGRSIVWFDGMMSILLLAAIVSLCVERQQRFFALFLGVPSIALSLAGYLSPAPLHSWVSFAGHLCEALFLFCSAVLIVRSLFTAGGVSADSVSGTICGFLFLGLAWAMVYAMITHAHPESFVLNGKLSPLSDGPPAADLLTYYSFVTLTTVGYGDVVPATPITRTCEWIEAASGQFYLAVIVAGLASMLASRQRLPSKSE